MKNQNKDKIVSRLLKEGHITAEEAVALLKPEPAEVVVQPVNVPAPYPAPYYPTPKINEPQQPTAPSPWYVPNPVVYMYEITY